MKLTKTIIQKLNQLKDRFKGKKYNEIDQTIRNLKFCNELTEEDEIIINMAKKNYEV